MRKAYEPSEQGYRTKDDAIRTSSKTEHAIEAHVPEDVLERTRSSRTRQLVEMVVQVLKVRPRDLPRLRSSARLDRRRYNVWITQHIQGMFNLERKGVKDE